ncbi:hydroxyacid dehydrogenase [Paenibacillus allorhizosphaerae]|uniref:(S)-sulfolactate dehydrogenase n=1 Tax=Paenibacillus allorhizosphaerae TaxID=2849866 RepID=A0ABM8VAC4_9BACL|nr:hydroxyacid dehydrogenase [Paenibacillus allorhizosphaerae]CAG7616093.1 (S)-sulfolactate dehydrogenase [Paenibacillus allorhizosphaerae]
MKIVISELDWPDGAELLRRKGWEVRYDPEVWRDRTRLLAEVEDAAALIVRNQTSVDEELLERGHGLKVVGRLGVGLDNIDLKAASSRQIPVVYGKYANANSVAEYVVTAILSYCRPLFRASAEVREGRWDRKRNTGTELYGSSLGLIGLGDIGHRVAVRAKALGMKAIGYDPYVGAYDFAVTESGIRLAGLEQVLEEADFISLHIPLTKQTADLINEAALERMKPGAILINSSRGGIVNEHDLYRALKRSRIAGAFLDVLAQEPPDKEHPLLTLDNCWITPHIAGLTEQSQVRTSEMVASEVIRELEGTASLCRVALK